MPVSSITNIEQIVSEDFSTRIQNFVESLEGSGVVRDATFTESSTYSVTHLPAIVNPEPRQGLENAPETDKDDWADSPTRQPNLLYRHRFAFGRDNRNVPELDLGADGQRWGALDSFSGILIYNEEFGIESSTTIRQFLNESTTRVQNFITGESSGGKIRNFVGETGSVDFEQYPFLITALPEPWSIKNPVDTDVFIRLANFSTPTASGTISLSLDGVEKVPLQIVEFFGGLGGFDVTWENDQLFDYDATVRVEVEFSDTDSPPNSTYFTYTFDTVSDLSGPRIQSIIPEDRTEGVSVGVTIRFTVVDFETGVDIDSLRLYVNDALVENGVTGVLITTALEDGSGYEVEYTPSKSFMYGDFVPVAIFVRDNSVHENETFYVYRFTTEESSIPLLINLAPSSCTAGVSISTDVQFDIIDGGHGLRRDSILVTINDMEPDNLQFVPVIHREED